MSGRLPDFHQRVRAEWIDYNGHMSEAFYVLVFGHATDALMDAVGLGPGYREESGCSLYTVEAHVRYLREVEDGTPLTLRTRILGVDAKKLRFAHEMYAGPADESAAVANGSATIANGSTAVADEPTSVADEPATVGHELVATSELFALHVGGEGSVPFPAEVRERLAGLTEEPPPWAGRAIGPVPRA
ncbi:thioesterase family protein [Streptomyces sp. NBC_01795]|uniref:thioesterase family protein n=1 Tax=unclassified Streptomyces TaxID=2593676 RepID=UPI002DD7DEC8|nr:MULTISPECIES: thioesterase family protein [unclassified Streptomyces]WSA93096.1 thioesterase family protein [Streptomyces sp. NBC_01795]WSB77465.1 thioesterase family protein [Streptomyces sp. NBC_01775]WSS14269.1 thioesterase family protein [Streptomyces sp. NBC_01186]